MRAPTGFRRAIRAPRLTPSSSSIAWWSTATGLCAMFVATLVIAVCPVIRTTPTATAPTFSSPADTSSAAREQVSALTARLTDQRTRAALPRTSDLAATGEAHDLTLRSAPTASAHIFGERSDTAHDSTNDGLVTGDAVAFSASDAGGRGRIGTATLSGAGTSAATSAMIAGRGRLAVHAGFTIARHTTTTGTIHTSVRPLGRPG